MRAGQVPSHQRAVLKVDGDGVLEADGLVDVLGLVGGLLDDLLVHGPMRVVPLVLLELSADFFRKNCLKPT